MCPCCKGQILSWALLDKISSPLPSSGEATPEMPVQCPVLNSPLRERHGQSRGSPKRVTRGYSGWSTCPVRKVWQTWDCSAWGAGAYWAVSIHRNTWREGAGNSEPGPFQCCPVTPFSAAQDKRQYTQTKHRRFPLNITTLFLIVILWTQI